MKTSTPSQLSGRDHHLVDRALYVAARALRAEEHPPLADIKGMNELLDRYYSRDKEMYDLHTKVHLAMSLGFQLKPGELHKEDVERWIADHLPDDNVRVVPLHDRRAGRNPEDRQ